jgi:hypothetical protein
MLTSVIEGLRGNFSCFLRDTILDGLSALPQNWFVSECQLFDGGTEPSACRLRRVFTSRQHRNRIDLSSSLAQSAIALVRVSIHRIRVAMASGCPTAGAWGPRRSGLQPCATLRPPEQRTPPRRFNPRGTAPLVHRNPLNLPLHANIGATRQRARFELVPASEALGIVVGEKGGLAPYVRFLSIDSHLCSTLPSDPHLAMGSPCASLTLHLHEVGRRTRGRGVQTPRGGRNGRSLVKLEPLLAIARI